MTNDEWQQVQTQLTTPLGVVVLNCDGYEITLRVEPFKGLQMCIMTYIDGWFKGEWVTNDCEIRRKFMRPEKFYLYPRSSRLRAKELSKRRLAELKNTGLNPWKRGVNYTPTWLSFGPLKRHLQQNCTHIELVKVGP